jgi:hypothetical protein
VANLAAVCFASGANFGTFVMPNTSVGWRSINELATQDTSVSLYVNRIARGQFLRQGIMDLTEE